MINNIIICIINIILIQIVIDKTHKRVKALYELKDNLIRNKLVDDFGEMQKGNITEKEFLKRMKMYL
ncbi:hypothetical protein [Clostridium senegalense]